MLLREHLTSLTADPWGQRQGWFAAVSDTVVAAAAGVFLMIGSAMRMAMACVMGMLMLLYGTQATVTIRLGTRDQSLGKLSEFLTVLPPLPLLPQALSV